MTDQIEPSRFALVRVPIAPVHSEPRVSSAQTTQTTFGHVVALIAREGEWNRVHTLPDRYEGWLHAGYMIPVDTPPIEPGPEMSSVAGGRATLTMRVSLGATIRAGTRTLQLPLGAWVGPDVTVLEGEVVPMDELPVRFPPTGDAIARTAARYFGSTSYQWGGVTPWGADCSGFVQTVFALHGLELPRDASQQAPIGTDAGRDLAAHEAGDLLFFSEREDGRVTHVGLAAGAGRMLHVALGRGGYAEEDLADDDDPYVATLRARFVGARRVPMRLAGLA